VGVDGFWIAAVIKGHSPIGGTMRRSSTVLGSVLASLLALSPAVGWAQDKPARPKAAPVVSTPVNLNTASAADLEALPGVGAATAKLIIEHREKNGGFKKVEELMNIKGIGEKSFLKLKPMVTVSPLKAERQDDGATSR
jgi:competence protein ComEA